MNNYFDLKRMFSENFGYEPPSDYEFVAKEVEAQNSLLGAPLYDMAQGRSYYLPVKLNNIYLPYPVVSIRGSKTIVETPMVELDGTVKEFISMDDYSITIRGIIVSDNHLFPEEKITELRDLWLLKKAVPINNALTAIFLDGDQKVVIKSFDLPEVVGVKGARPYVMELVSDRELELEIK